MYGVASEKPSARLSADLCRGPSRQAGSIQVSRQLLGILVVIKLPVGKADVGIDGVLETVFDIAARRQIIHASDRIRCSRAQEGKLLLLEA